MVNGLCQILLKLFRDGKSLMIYQWESITEKPLKFMSQNQEKDKLVLQKVLIIVWPHVNIGVFQINEDLDKTYMFTDISNAKYLLNYEQNQISSIELKLQPNADEAEVTQAILTQFGDKFIVKNRAQLNDALYKMLNTENLAVYLIFTLVIIIALFNVIGALIMMILDKKGSLHTLFNLGATTKDIKRIFFLQGSLMTVLGGVIGVIIGIIIVFFQQQYNLVMLTVLFPIP